MFLRFYIMLVKSGIKQTNNVKNRVRSCGSSGGGNLPVAAALPALPVFLAVSHMVIGFQRRAQSCGNESSHWRPAWETVLYSTRGKAIDKWGFVSPDNVPSSLFNPGNPLQLEPPNKWETHVWKCVCLCVCRYSRTTLHTFIILIQSVFTETF